MRLYPSNYRLLYRHWFKRFGFFLLGILLLYAPFALLARLVFFLTNTPSNPDAHSVCMRMPIQWLAQPWMYGTLFERPVYLVAVLVLPLLALFLGPLFCGWMCPAGQMTEFVSRIVPPRFQMNLSGKGWNVPVRYGFLAGMMAIPFIGGNTCCSFCNFTHAQNIISAFSGDTLGITYWASFSIFSFFLWFVVLGLFTAGGRGWCNFLCPAGALMGLAHSFGVRLKLGRSMKIDHSSCRGCNTCSSVCPAWAITRQEGKSHINHHACTACMDCTKVCPQGAIAYGRTLETQAIPLKEAGYENPV